MFGPAWAGQDREQGPQAAASAAQQVDKQRTEKRQPDVNPCSRQVAETAFLKNLWCDQKTIWSVPLSARQHLGFILPFAGATAALIATDQSAGRELSERPPGSVLDASTDISHLASVFASRYPDKPAVKYGACGLAALISASRLTARRHFPSDVLVGGVFGYLIGRYVVRAHTH
jgi:hypothetical protein